MDHTLPLPTDNAPRMAPLGRLPAVAVAHLTLMAGLAWAWLAIAGAARGPLEGAICAAPALLAFGLGFSSQADRQQYVARLLAGPHHQQDRQHRGAPGSSSPRSPCSTPRSSSPPSPGWPPR